MAGKLTPLFYITLIFLSLPFFLASFGLFLSLTGLLFIPYPLIFFLSAVILAGIIGILVQAVLGMVLNNRGKS